jgi:hypothetical protein
VAQRDLFSENQLLHLQTVKEFNRCMDLMGEFVVQKTTRSPELGAQEQEEWQNGGWERCGSTGLHGASRPSGHTLGMPNLSQQAAGAPPFAANNLESALGQQTASTSNNDGAQEEEAMAHAENRYQVNYEKGKGKTPLRMNFEKNGDGKHAVTEVIKGGMAAQQNVRVGDLLVGLEGTSFDGMSEQEVTREIKESKSTGKLELIRLEKNGGVDLRGGFSASPPTTPVSRDDGLAGPVSIDIITANILGPVSKQKENASVILLNWWTECMANAAQQLDVVKAECLVDDKDIFELKDVLDADQQVIGHLLCGFCRITPSALLTLLISGYPHSYFSPAGPSASAANSPSLFVSPSAEFRHPP